MKLFGNNPQDSNGSRHLVLLHTSNNPTVRLTYLFMKACPIQLLLVPGILAVGDLIENSDGETAVRSSPRRRMVVPQIRDVGLLGSLPYIWSIATGVP